MVEDDRGGMKPPALGAVQRGSGQTWAQAFGDGPATCDLQAERFA